MDGRNGTGGGNGTRCGAERKGTYRPRCVRVRRIAADMFHSVLNGGQLTLKDAEGHEKQEARVAAVHLKALRGIPLILTTKQVELRALRSTF